MPQMPPTQEGVPLVTEHEARHIPQCIVEVCVFVSQPFAALPSQLPKPGLHEPTVQRPLTQAGVPLAVVHRMPQPPQCSTLVFTSMQLMPQRMVPPEQPEAQVPERLSQTGVLPLHALPQRPQFSGWLSEDSQPFIGLPSQSANPGRHEN
jgi:hypothetical protein